MKKHYIFSLCLCFLCTTSFFCLSAQEYNNFDLNKYYTPNIVRNALDLDFSSSGQFANVYNEFDHLSVTNESFSSNIAGTINSSFSTYRNTRKRISSLMLNGSFSGSYSSIRETTGSTNKNNSNTGGLNLNYSDKFYKTSTLFLSAGIIARLIPTYNKQQLQSDPNPREINEKINRYYFNPSIGIGIGRIEQVQDARQAIYLLDDLSKKGVLSRQLTNNEVFSLAQQMSKIKNKRFLDSRLRLIEEVTTIDAFFVNNGSSFEEYIDSYFVTVLQKSYGMFQFEIEIMFIRLRSEAYFLDDYLGGLGFDFFLLLLLFVKQLLVINQFADRRIGVRRNFDKVEFGFFCHFQCLLQRVDFGFYTFSDNSHHWSVYFLVYSVLLPLFRSTFASERSLLWCCYDFFLL